MSNYLYFLDLHFELYRVIARMIYEMQYAIKQLMHRIWQVSPLLWWVLMATIGVSYTGRYDGARYQTTTGEAVIRPKGIVVEHIWTASVTSATPTCAISPTTTTNSYIVATISGPSGYNTVNGATLNGSAMTQLAYPNSSGSGAVLTAIYGKIPSSYAAQNVVFTLGSSAAMKIVVYQLSGVHQTTTLIDSQTAGDTTLSSISVTTASAAYGMDIQAIVTDSFAHSPTPTSGQTTVTVAGTVVGGYQETFDTSQTDSYSYASSIRMILASVTLRPA